MRLRITTCQGGNTHAVTQAVAAYLGEQVGLNNEVVIDQPWPERKHHLLNGDIHIGWICGLWYAQQAAKPEPPLDLLTVPIFRAARYQNRPVYYADVVVRRDSWMHRFADLAGSTWAFNEPDSLSGNLVMRQALAKRGQTPSFFGQLHESGGHLQSMAMVADGRADVAAIDSTIWDDVQHNRPELRRRLRVIEVLGPYPAPPWVISRRVPAELKAQIREILLDMHHRPGGIKTFKDSILQRFSNGVRHTYAALPVNRFQTSRPLEQ